MQKISSDNNSKDDLDPNYYIFMHKLIQETKENWKGKHIHGFIQQWSLEPFYTVMFSEKQLKVLLSLEKDTVFCHLDATGGIVLPPSDVSKRIFYYSLILLGNKDCNQFPVAEFISSVHNTLNISHFLRLVVIALKKLSKLDLRRLIKLKLILV